MTKRLAAQLGMRNFNSGFARLAHAECHVELDGSDVWNCVRYEGVVPAGEPYWTFARTFAQVDRPQTTTQQQNKLRALLDSSFD